MLDIGKVCQRIWPERWVRETRLIYRSPKIVSKDESGTTKETTAADLLWPLNPGELYGLLGQKVPTNLDDFFKTEYAQRVIKVYPLLLDKTPDQVKRILTANLLQIAWHVSSWQDNGARLYVLDQATTEALCWTKVEDLEIDTLQLPVRSFYVQLPKELDWRVVLDKDNPNDPEPDQLMEGYMVTGEYVGDELKVLSIIMCGKAQKSHDDNMHWVRLKMEGCRTLGDLMHLNLKDVSDWLLDDELGLVVKDTGQHLFFAKPEAMRLLFGAILYITSAHPHLQALPPLGRPKGLPSTSKHKRQWQRYETATRASVTWVGGPLDGVGYEDGMGLEEDDVGLEGAKSIRRPPRPHMRAGHYRRVWLGPVTARTGRELRWIKPVVVGDWDRRLAWEAIKGHHVGKVRPAEVVDLPTPPGFQSVS